jgi:hypothetical protein
LFPIQVEPYNSVGQWSSLPIQAQARGKSLPELQKACGLMGLLVTIEERRALGVKISRIVCGNDYIKYKLPLPGLLASNFLTAAP